MKYTYLGRTGVTVSRLCLGCMSYGDPAWRPWILDEPAARPFFRTAIESGIRNVVSSTIGMTTGHRGKRLTV